MYGKCPKCGEKGICRERRPNGNDVCKEGHKYPSSTAVYPVASPVVPVPKENKQ